jgi:hypothetical protein
VSILFVPGVDLHLGWLHDSDHCSWSTTPHKGAFYRYADRVLDLGLLFSAVCLSVNSVADDDTALMVPQLKDRITCTAVGNCILWPSGYHSCFIQDSYLSLGDQLSWGMLISLVPSCKCHDHFLSCPFQFVIHSHLSIKCCITLAGKKLLNNLSKNHLFSFSLVGTLC